MKLKHLQLQCFFHVDEPTDVTSCAQLLVFVRYIHSGDIKEELYFVRNFNKRRCSGEVKIFFDSAGLQ